jgi:hypothetical protein
VAEEPKRRSATVLLREYFGYREGDGLAQFAAELKALSEDEKEQLAEGIHNGTLTY